MRIFLRLIILSLCLAVAWLAWVVFVPVSLPQNPYKLTVGANRTLNQIAKSLESEGVIRQRRIMVGLAKLLGAERKIKAGMYILNGSVSMWDVVGRLVDGHPDQASLTVIEGWGFHQFRLAVDKSADVEHKTQQLTDAQIMQQLGEEKVPAEGVFFPSTYFFTPGTDDIEIYQRAYKTMTTMLENVWAGRDAGLPYHTPYDLLIMASLIEKETSRDDDRPMVAAVFINRLNKGMRLQTDPSVIYGMGRGYKGSISKADLHRDTPYNTYTRAGLTPTPIALPGKAALEAAAHPAKSNALYFVAKGDGSSYFSSTLDEHNQAVRKFILKKEK